MFLRVWILSILLIVILWFLWNRGEGFQNPTPADDITTLNDFWSIVNEDKTQGSVATIPLTTDTSQDDSPVYYDPNALFTTISDSIAAPTTAPVSGSKPLTTRDKINAVMYPRPTDTFKLAFSKYISIYALAKYKRDPSAARQALLNNYDTLQGELVTKVQTAYEQAFGAAFTKDPKTVACAELNILAMSLYGQIIKITAAVTDLSGTEILAEKLHNENKAFQGSAACTNQSSGTPSAACIRLASQDETLFPILQKYDAANTSLSTNGYTLQNTLDVILQTYNGLQCTLPIGEQPNITSVFSNTYLTDLGIINSEALSLKLQELSPYYVSPTLITYITRQLLATTEFNTSMQTTADYIQDMAKTTNSIISLTNRMGSGSFFDESGAAGVRVCPAGYYCPSTTSSPLPCPVGSWCPAGTTDFPIPCPKGTYTPLGKSSQSDCVSSVPAGYYSANGVATICPMGGYCPAGATAPIPCSTGTYNPFKGKDAATACIPCPAGSYCSTTSSTPCPIGKYSNTIGATAETTCLTCPAGTYCSVKGLSVATPCPAGTYSSATGLMGQCTPFPEGVYSPNKGETSLAASRPCTIGHYCPKGSAYEISCPPGSYCPTASMATPTQCPAGRYGNATGLSDAACTGSCQAGYYCQPGSVTPTQNQCPKGFYCPAGTATTIPCTVGNYCPAGSSTPTKCPAGTFNTNTGGSVITDCQPCTAGNTCAAGTITPSPCPVGSFCPMGTQDPIPCIAGSYCDSTGLSDPIECPKGTYSTAVGATSMATCLPCENGLYNDKTGQTRCIGICQPGTYCPNLFACISYSPPTSGSGQVVSVPMGAPNAIPCPKGTYCPNTKMSTPLKCPVGTYSSSTGGTSQGACTPCHPGSYCPSEGGSIETPCPPGTYCPSSGGSAPNQCPVGLTCPVPGLTGGSICPPGFFCSASSQTPCPVGTYSAGGAVGSCTPCPVGTYGSTTGLTDATCSGLSAAGYIGVEGATSSTTSTLCPAGYYCLAGTTPTGANAPKGCPAGTYGSTTGLSTAACSGPCPAGRFCQVGTTNGIICPITNYCPSGSSTPRQCPSGTYGSTTGLSTAACSGPCQAGYYCPAGSGTATTTICPVGYYCPAGSSTKTACPPSTYGSTTGLTTAACSGLCQAGYYCPAGSTQANQSTCPLGFYCPAGVGSPTPCPAGTNGLATGLTASTGCIACTVGYTSAGTGGTCTACPAGTYAATAGQPSCTPCPAGTSSSTIGRTTACTACSTGQYSLAGSGTCSACPVGYSACDNTGRGTTQCVAGTYGTISMGASTCSPCPLNTASTTVGATTLSQCINCLPGSTASPGSTLCTICPKNSAVDLRPGMSTTGKCVSCNTLLSGTAYYTSGAGMVIGSPTIGDTSNCVNCSNARSALCLGIMY